MLLLYGINVSSERHVIFVNLTFMLSDLSVYERFPTTQH